MDDTTRLTRTHSMVYSAMLDDGSPHPRRSSKLYKAAIVSIVLLLAAIVTAAIAIPLSTASSNKASASVSAPYSPNKAPVQLLAAPAPAPAGSRKPSPVVITVQGSDAKLKWSRVTQAMFEEEYKNWKGRGIKINLQLTSSRLRPETLPTVYTPSNIQWVETSQADGTLLVSNLTERCRYSLRIPLGLVMWRQKAKLLGWPEGNLTLQALVQLAGPDAGWNAVPGALPDFANQPFKYGHGNPNASNSGREITIATIYSILGKPVTENLTVADVWANATQQGMRQIQRSVTHLDFHDRDLLEFMVEKGPSYLDAAVTYEPMVVEFNEANGTFLRDNYGDDFAFVFPADGTYWNFHPHCVLDLAPWNQNLTDPDLLDAAQVYVEWTSGPTAQQAAPVNGYRAYDPSVPYNAPAPSVPYQTQVTEAAGADPVKNEINVPRLQYQDTNVVFEINRMWKLAKKPVLVCMAIDTSLSMSGTNDMQDVKNAALSFIQSMTDNDYMRLLRFDQHVGVMQSGWMRDTRQEMQRAVQTMHASGRGSALYGTLVQCSDFLLQQMASYGPGVFNYEVVILSDGNGDDYLALKKDLDNLVRFIQETTTLNNLTSNGPLPLHVYGILYDTGLDTGFSRSFFEDIANQTSGKAYPFANQTSLQTIYEEIALYF